MMYIKYKTFILYYRKRNNWLWNVA